MKETNNYILAKLLGSALFYACKNPVSENNADIQQAYTTETSYEIKKNTGSHLVNIILSR